MTKRDPLTQYSKLRDELIAEKVRIEARLQELNEVLGAAVDKTPGLSVAAISSPANTGKLKMRDAIIQALKTGPLTRKELGEAVVNLGFQSKSKNILNNIGSVLYSKNSPVKSVSGKYQLIETAVS